VPVGSFGRPFLLIPCRLLEWTGVFFLIQQVERFFLFFTSSSLMASPTATALYAFMSCVPRDLVVAVQLLAGGAFLAVLLSLFVVVASSSGALTTFKSMYPKLFSRSCAFVAVVLVALLMVDASYYRFSQQHLNFVFFEYVADLFGDMIAQTPGSQAAEQTSAVFEMKEVYLAVILIALEGLIFLGWTTLFSRLTNGMVAGGNRPYMFSIVSVALLAMLSIMGAAGKATQTQLMPLPEAGDALFSLGQNAVLSAKESARAALFHQLEWNPRVPGSVISEEEAISGYQRAREKTVVFPSRRYPLVAQPNEAAKRQFKDPLNVVIIFVEGLDRRYLNRTVQTEHPIRLTPFLDRLQRQSVSFNNFFANGVQTSRGLFSTLCSYYPRHGSAAIKTRSDREYLCLPSVLRERGYRTKMVVGQSGTINNLRNFFPKNGIERLYDAHDFPPDAQRMGLGLTDGAMFDFVTDRIREAQRTKEPFFLTTLTLSTHHPFVFPTVHPEVIALLHEQDHYIPALRYFDSEFERFFTGLQEGGLLKNTVVFILGDHGRHEPEGETDQEREVGHFMAPLIVWLDESLRSPDTFVPRSVDVITSQVDIAPTVLAMTGMGQESSPFVGHDLSCLFIGDCLSDNTAYLTSVYDDLIGLVTKDNIWLYSFRKSQLYWTDLAARSRVVLSEDDTDKHWEYHRMLESYVASNILLEQDRIWPRRDVGLCCR
jgi:hypothetical protein